RRRELGSGIAVYGLSLSELGDQRAAFARLRPLMRPRYGCQFSLRGGARLDGAVAPPRHENHCLAARYRFEPARPAKWPYLPHPRLRTRVRSLRVLFAAVGGLVSCDGDSGRKAVADVECAILWPSSGNGRGGACSPGGARAGSAARPVLGSP